MTFLNVSNWPNGLKMLNSKTQIFTTLENKHVSSKRAILIHRVLAHESYIFGKRRLNMTCWKKPHQIWPNGLRDMAF
jgi:hypothetical protein